MVNATPNLPSTPPSLPQPNESEIRYMYRKYDEFSSTLQSQLKSLPSMYPCRLMLSKGQNKAPQLSPHTVKLIRSIVDQSNDESQVSKINNDRLTVQYPKGSTYNVKMKYLLPITQENYQIIVCPETTDYRRLCIVQTPKDHSFIEIGCDFAFTVGHVDCCKSLGIDKSPSSLEIAKKKFPRLNLEEMDVLAESNQSLMAILDRYEMLDRGKLIVAIDINGNRDLEAVIQCLKRVLDIWQPRLVIVKSRSLFSLMQGQNM